LRCRERIVSVGIRRMPLAALSRLRGRVGWGLSRSGRLRILPQRHRIGIGTVLRKILRGGCPRAMRGGFTAGAAIPGIIRRRLQSGARSHAAVAAIDRGIEQLGQRRPDRLDVGAVRLRFRGLDGFFGSVRVLRHVRNMGRVRRREKGKRPSLVPIESERGSSFYFDAFSSREPVSTEPVIGRAFARPVGLKTLSAARCITPGCCHQLTSEGELWSGRLVFRHPDRMRQRRGAQDIEVDAAAIGAAHRPIFRPRSRLGAPRDHAQHGQGAIAVRAMRSHGRGRSRGFWQDLQHVMMPFLQSDRDTVRR
jgi:hypothetical protein